MCISAKMVSSSSTRVIQVTNIAPQATKDQMQTLFGYLGKIDDIRLYPTIRDVSCPVQSRICYVKYYDSATVTVAQHMTNTVFIDRALIVIPMQSGEIPDEHKALEMSSNGTLVPGLNNVEPRLPAHVVNSLEGVPPSQVIQTYDPKLAALGLPPYPPLPAAYDSRKIEEIRRTLLLIDVGALTYQQIIDHFCQAGEVNYLRFCDRDVDQLKYALIEMTEQEGVLKALQLNGTTIAGQIILVHHATQAICKPQTKSNEAAQREIEEAMCRVKEAQNLISAAIDPVIGMLSKDKRRTRSRSRSRRRSRSRSRRSRSRHRGKRSRSRSRHRSRRSRSRHRHRTRSRSRHRSSRRSRSRSRHRSSRSKRDRSRDRDRDKKDKKDSGDKDKRDKDRDKDKDKDKEKSKSPPKEVEKEEREEVLPDKPEQELNGTSLEVKSKASSPVDDKERDLDKEKEKEKEKDVKEKEKSPARKKDRSRSRDRKRDRSRSKRRSRSRSRRKRSRSRRRSRSKDRKRTRSRDRKRSRSRDRKRSRSRDRKRSRSRDRKRTRSRDRKRSRSRDRKRSRSHSRRSKSRSHRDSKTPHERKSRDRSPHLPVVLEEKNTSLLDNKPIDIADEKNSPDNMDISNSP
ncbi:probable splicing factor, arginine/serine-rich 7 isoform X1 [Bicyclus anynana]|uniref:Probable splicing factor, arginine/serine-rich 7 isoform X1 n=1 Tax=Bicyclus anynana TaxID=110368 RepID=A0A6J1P9N2_BICAN|nr:probable splicing factor, arginine/serine-rich 7 isoform X1 [Bicyclus anynana]